MKMPFFKLGEAFGDVKNEFVYGNFLDKAGSIAKLAGKTVANVGMLAVEVGVDVVKNAPEHIGKVAENTLKDNKNLSSEQREKLEETAKKGQDFKEDRYRKEKAEREKSQNNPTNY